MTPGCTTLQNDSARVRRVAICSLSYLAQLKGAAFDGSAGFHQLGDIDADRLKSAHPESVDQMRGGLREHHSPAVANRVEPETLGVSGRGQDRIREQPTQHRLAAGRERRRVVHHGVTKHGQRSVEMIEPRFHQCEADHRTPEAFLSLVVRPSMGAKARARQHQSARLEEIALALIDTLSFVNRVTGAGAKPPAICLLYTSDAA